MNTERRTELMHAVLDGEATDEQARQLQLLLDADPAAKGEFERLQSLFDDLAAVPQRHPPEGLVHAVMTAVNGGATGVQRRHEERGVQLSGGWRVFGSILRARGSKSSATLRPASGTESTRRGAEMNKLWIGGGAAAIAVVLAVQFGVTGQGDEKAAAGTVVPAERYRATQATGTDIKVNPNAGGVTAATTVDTSGGTSQSNTAQNSTAQNSTAQNSTAQNSTAQNSTAQNNTAQNNTAQNNTAQNSTAQNSTAQNATAQNATAQSATAQSRAAQSATAQNATAQSRAAQSATAQSATAQNATAQSATAQSRAAQNSTSQNAAPR